MDDVADPDVNAEWVTQQLAADTSTCSLKSIVLVGHKFPSRDVNSALNTYFSTCGTTLPTLAIAGNNHPRTYCMDLSTKTDRRVELTVEAFKAGAIQVSIVRDENGNDYFHVSDTDLVNSNSQCPQLNVTTSSPSTPVIPTPTTAPMVSTTSPVTSSPTTSDPTVSPSQSPVTSSPSKSPSLSPVTANPITSDPTVSQGESPVTSSPSNKPTIVLPVLEKSRIHPLGNW